MQKTEKKAVLFGVVSTGTEILFAIHFRHCKLLHSLCRLEVLLLR